MNLVQLDTKAESRRFRPTVSGSIWIKNPSDEGSKASDLKCTSETYLNLMKASPLRIQHSESNIGDASLRANTS